MRPVLLLLMVVALAGCGARENPALLTRAEADALLARVDEARKAVADNRCDEARRALRDADQQVDALGDATSKRLRDNLAEWIEQARSGIGDACKEEPQETPTPAETETPEATETPEPTATPSPEPTEEPTATPTAEPTVNPGNGTGGTGGTGTDGGGG